MGTVQRVVLVWTVRYEEEIAPFAELLWQVCQFIQKIVGSCFEEYADKDFMRIRLLQVRQNNPFDAFEFVVHVTQPSASSTSSSSLASAALLGQSHLPAQLRRADDARFALYPDLKTVPIAFNTGRPNLLNVFASLRARCSSVSSAARPAASSLGHSYLDDVGGSPLGQYQDRQRGNVRTMVLTCGPESMVAETEALCERFDMEFHSEVFAY